MVFNTKEIVKEWSHRVSSGMPDKNNTWHVDKLKKLLIEKKYPKQFINEYIRVLINEGEQLVPNPKPGNQRKKMVTLSYAKQFYKDQGINTDDMTIDQIQSMAQSDGEGKQKRPQKSSGLLKLLKSVFDRVTGIDGIDKTAKEGGLDRTVTAPGNMSSVINEIGTGYGMGHLSDDPNMSVDDLEQKIYDDMKGTEAANYNGDKKTRNACRAAAKSAIREFERSQQTIKKNGMNPESTKVSHVWGSKQSLDDTVKHLEDLGVTEVNGIQFDPDYKKIILEGGAGENPTDTMVVMVDDSQKPPKVVINHTSNKTSSDDLQGNSSPEKNAEAIRKQADKDLKNKKITQDEYDSVVTVTKKLESDLADKQKEIDKLIQEQNDKLRAKLPRKLIDELKVLSKPTTGGTSAVYWQKTVMNHQNKINPPLNPPNSKRKFNKDTGTYTPPLTPDEEERIAASYVKEMEDAANGVVGAQDPDKGMNKILARVVPPPRDELRQLYHDQHKLITDSRNKLNDTVKSKNAPQPYGDYTASKNFLHRLHVDVIEGHNPGGIPKENFEVNCGNNESGVVYDKSGNEYIWTSKGYLKAPLKKDKKGKILGGADDKKGIKPRGDGDGNINPAFDDGDNAVVINEKNIAACLGVKPPVEDIAEHIRVSEVESSSGVTGNVTIYDLDGNIIGEQAIRPKGGTGTKVQDTVKFHSSFQKCLQRESKN